MLLIPALRCEHRGDLCRVLSFRTLLLLSACLLFTSSFGQKEDPGSTEHVNEVIVVNTTSWPVEVRVAPKDASMQLLGMQFMIQPRDTIQIANYTTQGTFRSPVEVMTVKGIMTTKRGKEKTIGVLMMEKRAISKQHRMWFYHVMPVGGGSIGFGF